MDEQIGRLRRELRDLGISENTMLWFTSDNGPEGDRGDQGTHRGSAGAFRGRERSLWEGGIHVLGLLEWPASIKPSTVSSVPSSTLDYYPTTLNVLGLMPERQPQSTDGISLLPLIQGKMVQRPVPIPFETLGTIDTNASRGSPKMALVDNLSNLLTDMEQVQNSCMRSLAGKDYAEEFTPDKHEVHPSTTRASIKKNKRSTVLPSIEPSEAC